MTSGLDKDNANDAGHQMLPTATSPAKTPPGKPANVIMNFLRKPAGRVLVTRLILASHVLFTLAWIYHSMPWKDYYYFIGCGFLLMLIEAFCILCVRQGRELRWFSTSSFFYLLMIIPCVWLMEVDLCKKRMASDLKTRSALSNYTRASGSQRQTVEEILFMGMSVPVLAPHEMTLVLEMVIFFLLVLVRALLPKGGITRTQLSELLLCYIGMGADIFELFEMFGEDSVSYNKTLIIVILAVWSFSLLQFTIVLTPSNENSHSMVPEIVSIIIPIVLQDGPFMILRLVLILEYGVEGLLHIYFATKNCLVILLYLYRIYAIRRPARGGRDTAVRETARL